MMTSEMLHTSVRTALVDAGWDEARNVSATRPECYCGPSNLELPVVIRDLLSNLYGLKVVLAGRWIDFHPETVMSILVRDDIELLESVVKERLYPIGTSS